MCRLTAVHVVELQTVANKGSITPATRIETCPGLLQAHAWLGDDRWASASRPSWRSASAVRSKRTPTTAPTAVTQRWPWTCRCETGHSEGHLVYLGAWLSPATVSVTATQLAVCYSKYHAPHVVLPRSINIPSADATILCRSQAVTSQLSASMAQRRSIIPCGSAVCRWWRALRWARSACCWCMRRTMALGSRCVAVAPLPGGSSCTSRFGKAIRPQILEPTSAHEWTSKRKKRARALL